MPGIICEVTEGVRKGQRCEVENMQPKDITALGKVVVTFRNKEGIHPAKITTMVSTTKLKQIGFFD